MKTAIGLSIFVALLILSSQYGWRQSVLFVIGVLLGITLYKSSFGFASAYRKLILNRDGQGIYAQLLMLSITTILFAPLLSAGKIFGQELGGAIAPVGVSGVIGAFIFGIGMQLGGACGCGTLYTIGSGSYTMIITLITFCLGSFCASISQDLWSGLPQIPPIVLGETIGWKNAVIVQLIVFFFLAIIVGIWTKNSPISPKNINWRDFLHNPWSIFMGGIILGLLNWLTLVISGQPWRITWGFALWMAKIAMFLGWNPSSSKFWDGDPALSSSVLADTTSIMNLDLILGALLAAGLAGKLIPQTATNPSTLLSKAVGGLIMGFGAFAAFGCNIGAFFSGIASTSLHGWLWIIFALLGTFLIIKFTFPQTKLGAIK